MHVSPVQPFAGAFRGKRVLVTGHTGFKGAWLSEWLLALGAQVTGLGLPPPTQPALFEQLGLAGRLDHRLGDVRDPIVVQAIVDTVKPDYVFHLAAQALVRWSYTHPVDTYATNVMGTINVLEAVRLAARPCVVIAVTTDKCYENREWVHSYREEDALGGFDPYSSSKGAAELVIAAYRRSYFSGPSPVRLASVRAGNVIGGGDWAMDRIVPDCIRALQRHEAIPVRNKIATRPWQHVLEPLSGYLWLAACLSGARPSTPADPPLTTLCGAFNFGPELASNRSVQQLVEAVLNHWNGRWEDHSDPQAVHEAQRLNLAIDKAHHLLHWSPAWDFASTVAHSVAWYRSAIVESADAGELTRRQIMTYMADARSRRLPWAMN